MKMLLNKASLTFFVNWIDYYQEPLRLCWEMTFNEEDAYVIPNNSVYLLNDWTTIRENGFKRVENTDEKK